MFNNVEVDLIFCLFSTDAWGKKKIPYHVHQSSAKQKAMEFIKNRHSKFLVNIHLVRKIVHDLLLDKSTKDYDHAIREIG